MKGNRMVIGALICAFLLSCMAGIQKPAEQDETKLRLIYEMAMDTVQDHKASLLPGDRKALEAMTHQKRSPGKERGFFTAVILRLVPMLIDIILDLDADRDCRKCKERCDETS